MRRWWIFALLAVAPLLVTAAQAEGFSDAQKREIEGIVHDYLISNPEALKEALDGLQAHMEQQQQAQMSALVRENLDALTKAPASPVGGNPNGDVTLVEFFDYTCGYCKASYPLVQALLQSDPSIRMVYKEFPILSEASSAAAKAALAAAKQGKYVPYHDALFTHEGAMDYKALLMIAEKTGLDVEKWKADLADPAIAAELEANLALARKLALRGTPAFVIGEELFPGAMALEDMKAAVARARAAKATSAPKQP